MQCNIARMVVWGGLVSKSSVPNAAERCPIMFEESVGEGEKGKWGACQTGRGVIYILGHLTTITRGNRKGETIKK